VSVDRITVGRYRSLYDVTFEPGRFTVLVGPNNSGKTNLVEAIEFLADAYRYGVETAIARKGGIENIAFRRMRRTKSPVAFKVNVTLNAARTDRIGVRRTAVRIPRDAQFHLTHAFALAAIGQAIEAPFRIIREEFHIAAERQGVRNEVMSLARSGSSIHVTLSDKRPPRWTEGVVFPFDDPDFVHRIEQTLQPTALLVSSASFYSLLPGLAQELSGTRLYQVSPIEARRSGVPTPNPELDRYGGNLPAYVNQIRKRASREWSQVLEAMRNVIPDLEDIQTTYGPDRRLALEFKERGVGRPWTAEEVSDGTIQSLALFASLRRSSRLILIEEPENSLHPWIVRQFVDACRNAAGDQQVVLTTHSPALIGYLDPREITLVWRSEGRTHVQPLTSRDAEVLAMWQRGELSTFDILDTGAVPVAVPGGQE
jgi:predicted ATPase